MSHENLEIVHQAVEAFNRHDAEAMQALCTPDVEVLPLRAALEGTAYRGPNAAARFMADSDESWENARLDIEEVREVGESLLARGRLRGRGRTSGADVDATLAVVIRIQARKVASMRTYTNSAEALEALGLPEQDAHADT
jgi:ketosteroid isomerase-like protein